MQEVANSQNFGQQVHQLKTTRAEEGTTSPLGKDVSAMAHERNAERKAEKTETDTVIPIDQVDLNITDGTNTDAAVTTIVTQNINESLQSATEASESSVALRTANDDESLSDVIRSGFSSLLADYQQQNPEQTDEESLSNFTDLMQIGVEKGFTEAQETLSKGTTWDEESLNQLTATKEEIRNLIGELSTSFSATV